MRIGPRAVTAYRFSIYYVMSLADPGKMVTLFYVRTEMI
jgi:hypothetical protein